MFCRNAEAQPLFEQAVVRCGRVLMGNISLRDLAVVKRAEGTKELLIRKIKPDCCTKEVLPM